MKHVTVLQVIHVLTGEMIYQYDVDDHGTHLRAVEASQLLILDDVKNRKLMLCNSWIGMGKFW